MMKTVVGSNGYIEVKELDEYEKDRLVVLYSKGMPYARSIECQRSNQSNVFRLLCLRTGLINWSSGFSTLGDLCRQEQFYNRTIKVFDDYKSFLISLRPLIECYKKEGSDE